MKRLLFILLALLLVVVWAAACGGEQTPAPQETAKPKAQDTAIPTATSTPTPTATPTPTPTPTPDPTFPMHTTHFSFGVNIDMYNVEEKTQALIGKSMSKDELMGYVDDLGMEWVRHQIWWSEIEPNPGEYNWEELDEMVATIGRHNRKLLVDIVRSPAWATADGGHGMPADPNTLGDLLYAMATRYRGQIQAYEIWNEQNYAVENDGYVEGAGRYVELLKVAFTRIKEADPHAMVLFGPLTPTGVNDPNIAIDDTLYLEQAYQYQEGIVRQYFDVLGVHVAGSNNPPDTLWPDNPGPGGWTDHPSHYFRHFENLRAVMEAYGDADKQIWITEFGWASIEGLTDVAAPGYEYAYENSALAVGDYLPWAMNMARTKYDYIGAVFVWNLNFSTTNPPTDEKSAFGMLMPDWGTRPSYRAVRHYVPEHSEWP